MALDDFLTLEEQLGDNYQVYLELKTKLEKDGLPPNIASYKASELLTPEKLEKIKLLANNEEDLRKGITFFFDSEEELKLLAKYFQFNPHTRQIKNGKLLIELLKLLNNE